MPYFIDTTVNGTDVRVFLFPAEWRRGCRISARIDADIESGNLSVEARTAAMESILLTISGDLTLHEAEAEAFKKAIGGLGTKLAAFPIYPDVLPKADWAKRIFSPQWIADFTFGGSAQVLPVGSVGSAANDLVAPLIFGRFMRPPQAKLITDSLVEIPIKFIETAPWSFRVDPNPYGTGWTESPDWIDEPTEEIILDTSYANLAPRGEVASKPQAISRWAQAATFLFDSREKIREALTFFKNRSGPVKSFTMPTWLTLSSPTTAAPATMQCRFKGDSIELEFDTDSSAYAQVEFIQEVSSPGFSQEPTAGRYMVRLRYNSTTVYDELWTDWDKPLVGPGGQTFEPRQMRVERMRRSLRPQDEHAEVTFGFRSNDLLHDFYRERLFADITLSIWKGDPANPAAAALRWEGRVSRVSPKGEQWKVEAQFIGGIFEQQVPRFLLKRTCNWCVFDANCGLSESAHSSTGTFTPAAVISPKVVDIALSGWGGASYASNWFAGGEFRTGSGRNMMSIGITQSEMVSGKVRLYLSRAVIPDYISASQSCTVVPGCDLTADTCKNKFSNYNGEAGAYGFSGAPFLPDYISTQNSSTPAPSK